MKNKLSFLLMIGFLISVSLPAIASSFSGMVMSISIYGITVKNGDQIKMFQIRPETKEKKQPQAQDVVKVYYRVVDGVPVATTIKVVKQFIP